MVGQVIEDGVAVANDSLSKMVLGADWKLVRRTRGTDGEWWSGAPQMNDTEGMSPSTVAREAFHEGFTVVVNAMEDRWPPITNVAAAVEDELGYHLSVNAYMTPPRQTGFEAHFDWMDVIIFQVGHSGRWGFVASHLGR